MGKKVLIITGSPRLKGNTNALVTAFASGAVAVGNEVEVFDAATANLNGCHADKSCEQRGCCGQKDDGVRMNELMREADVLVLASPVYWSGFTSQIKTAIDRFYANNAQIQTPKKAALLLTSGDAEWDVTAGAIGTYKGICGYLGWSDAGIIAAGGCSVLGEIKQTEFPQKAYLLGKNFGA